MAGDTLITIRRQANPDPAPELAEAVTVSRFWRNVEVGPDNECWPWRGDTDRDGYGVFFYRGRRRPAHEMALSFTTGESRLPELDTCHTCDHPRCCNPAHLRFDTRQANVDDMISHRRHPRGSQTPATRLTEEEVLTIRHRRANGARCVDLARDFGISESAITAIVHGRNWKHVGGPVTNRHITRTGKAA